jgi:hypothetical protein
MAFALNLAIVSGSVRKNQPALNLLSLIECCVNEGRLFVPALYWVLLRAYAGD